MEDNANQRKTVKTSFHVIVEEKNKLVSAPLTSF